MHPRGNVDNSTDITSPSLHSGPWARYLPMPSHIHYQPTHNFYHRMADNILKLCHSIIFGKKLTYGHQTQYKK